MVKAKENFPYEAIAVLGRVLEENSNKYEPGHWRKVHFAEHCKHAKEHLDAVGKYDFVYGRYHNKEDLENAFVRLAMAVAVREVERKEIKNKIHNANLTVYPTCDHTYNVVGGYAGDWVTKQSNLPPELNKLKQEIDDILAQYTWHDDWF